MWRTGLFILTPGPPICRCKRKNGHGYEPCPSQPQFRSSGISIVVERQFIQVNGIWRLVVVAIFLIVDGDTVPVA